MAKDIQKCTFSHDFLRVANFFDQLFWCLTPDLGSEAVFSIISKLLWQVDLCKNLLFYTHTNKIMCCRCPLSLLFLLTKPMAVPLFTAWFTAHVQAMKNLPMADVFHIVPPVQYQSMENVSKMKDPLSLNMTFGLEHLLQTNNAWTAPECDQSHLYATTKEDLFFESVSDQCV